ncbi:MAG: hypothetical protein R2882_11990 [Gemmatimonadales bacterium]
MGNRFERFAPCSRSSRGLVNLVKMSKFYLMIRPEEAPRYLGHNPLQQLSYTLIYAVAVVSVLTGFALTARRIPRFFHSTLAVDPPGRAPDHPVRPPRRHLGVP